MTDIIQKVRQFTEAVGCTTDHYNVRQTALYEGLALEEGAEAIEAMLAKANVFECADFYFLEGLAYHMHKASELFKKGALDKFVECADRDGLLDSAIDRIWVTIGSALSQGADVEGAAGEVARANLDKLVPCPVFVCAGGERTDATGKCENCNGTSLVAIKDANGKVRKPDGWVGPNIEPFVCRSGAA